ncbi:MAG: FAD-binding oxidoreductase [Desulfurococcales archaeon]|nr:FAD-binding oxidoreductase [Desulfurococcales archaeon]
MRVAVVGLGVAGLMIAWTLSSRGFRVYAIDDESRLSATHVSAGIVTLLMPEPFIHMALRSLEVYRENFKSSAVEANLYWIHKRDTCSIGIARTLDKLRVNLEFLSEGKRDFRVPEGLEFKLEEGEALARLNTVIVDTGSLRAEVLRNVEDYIVGRAKVKCGIVSIGNETVKADYIILSMGPWTPLPKDTAMIYACETAFLKAIVNVEEALALIDDSLDFYAVFRGGEVQVGNGGYRASTRPEELYSPDPESIGFVLDSLALRVAGASAWEVDRVLSVPCVSCPDAAPAVGPLPTCPSTIVATGLNGAGVSLAPALAEILADYIEGRKEIPSFLRLDRRVKDLGIRPSEPFRLCPST